MRFLIPALVSLLCNAAFVVAGAFTVPVIFTVFYDQNNPADGNIPVGEHTLALVFIL